MAALAESGLSLSASLNDDALDSGDGGLGGVNLVAMEAAASNSNSNSNSNGDGSGSDGGKGGALEAACSTGSHGKRRTRQNFTGWTLLRHDEGDG